VKKFDLINRKKKPPKLRGSSEGYQLVINHQLTLKNIRITIQKSRKNFLYASVKTISSIRDNLPENRVNHSYKLD